MINRQKNRYKKIVVSNFSVISSKLTMTFTVPQGKVWRFAKFESSFITSHTAVFNATFVRNFICTDDSKPFALTYERQQYYSQANSYQQVDESESWDMILPGNYKIELGVYNDATTVKRAMILTAFETDN